MNIRETFTYFNMQPYIGVPVGGNVAAGAGGTDINRQGYDSLTFNINVMQISNTTLSETTSAPYKISCFFIRLQHTDASALGLGPSDYADVGSIDVIRQWSGAMVSGATAAGIALWITPSTMSGTIAKIGYRGNKQYVRAYLSASAMTGGASNIIAVEYMLGHTENWPVTIPNLDA
jgi:hypothetical protein